jgi:alpha-glucosidase
VTRLGGLDRARAAALLMLALPGSAYLYQGEELGLAEVTDLPEEVLADPMWERSGHTQRGRDGCRVPLPWSGSASPFGFGGPPWLPQPDAWAGHTAADQADDPSSTLSLYRAALAARRTVDGELTWLDSPREDVLVFARGDLVVTVNLGDHPVDLPAPGELVLASGDVHEVDAAKLPPATTAWWRVGKTDR